MLLLFLAKAGLDRGEAVLGAFPIAGWLRPQAAIKSLELGVARRASARCDAVDQTAIGILAFQNLRALADAATGFRNVQDINATFYQQPRVYQWTNTIRF